MKTLVRFLVTLGLGMPQLTLITKKTQNSEKRVRMDEVWVREENRPYPKLRESVLQSAKFYGEDHEFFSCIRHTDFRINKYEKYLHVLTYRQYTPLSWSIIWLSPIFSPIVFER